MRILIGVVAATLLMSTAAFAGQTEGLIKKIDKDALKPGMDIVIAYDVTNGENVVTDMQLPDSDSAD